MGWRVVEVQSTDNLRLFLNNLILRRTDKKITISISDIDVLLLDNYKITLSVQLINALTRANALVITFNGFHEPASYIISVEGNYNSLKILEKQIAWSNMYKGHLWKEIVKNKIINQKKILTSIQKINDKEQFFDDLAANIKYFDASNREGHAAKVYWHAMYGKGFTRAYRNSENINLVNSMLNYGYALLRGVVTKSIVKKGLDPRISLFHKSFSNFFALSSDLMEPFRVVIDQVVYQFRDQTIFERSIKEKLIKSLNTQIFVNGTLHYLNNAIDFCIDRIIAGKGWAWVDLWK